VGEVLGVDVSHIKFVWKSLYEPTAAERAAVYFQVAQGDEIYMTAGALRPEEVAISRFGAGEYSMETTIDPDMYRASLMMAPSPAPAAPAGTPPPHLGGPQPPSTEAGNAAGNAGPVMPPTMVSSAANPNAKAPAQSAGEPVSVAEKPEQNATNNQIIGKEAPTSSAEAPLAPGEVGGSNRMMEPQIVDVTGRGTPKGEQQPNKIPVGAAGVKPDDTPVQAPKPPTKETTPATDDMPKKTPGDKIHVKAGDTEIKITKAPDDDPNKPTKKVKK
jgi:hypothetical protein